MKSSAGGAIAEPLLDREMSKSSSVLGVQEGTMRVILAVLVCSSWMSVSSLLILLNKYIMVDLHFKYPMVVSSMGMMMSGTLSYLTCHVFKLVPANSLISFSFWLHRMLPVGFFMAMTLWTGNEVYLYLTVAFIQMLKAFTPVITMIALFIARLEDPTTAMIASVLLTALGTATAAYGEIKLSILGLVFMFGSETGEAIRLVMTQYLLVGLKLNPIEGLMYLAPACCFWLFVGASYREIPEIIEQGSLKIMWEHPFLFLAAAVMGFGVNALAYTAIKLASSLTLKVLGTVKNTLLVVIGMVFLSEVVTRVQALGYMISLAGFAWYNKIKMTQISASSAEVSSSKGGANAA